MSSRLIWVRVKIEQESWVFISSYGPGSERSEEEMKEFWSELSECGEFWYEWVGINPQCLMI